jgi:hypothetical protein
MTGSGARSSGQCRAGRATRRWSPSARSRLSGRRPHPTRLLEHPGRHVHPAGAQQLGHVPEHGRGAAAGHGLSPRSRRRRSRREAVELTVPSPWPLEASRRTSPGAGRSAGSRRSCPIVPGGRSPSHAEYQGRPVRSEMRTSSSANSALGRRSRSWGMPFSVSPGRCPAVVAIPAQGSIPGGIQRPVQLAAGPRAPGSRLQQVAGQAGAHGRR